MRRPEDIIKDGEKTRFSSENQPENRAERAGVPHRATVLKKWLSTELDIENPITKETHRGSVEDDVMLALITKARTGDVSAIKEILDTMYGKITDKVQIDVHQLDADIERELALIAAGGENPTPGEAANPERVG
jgi:hypothetical protein